ncbi:hypothetical protein Tco_0036909, partial [Tanacetum coccineum]
TYYDFATGKATPKKARKYKKVASPSRKLSPVLEKEPAEKPKRAKKHAKKSTIVPTAGVIIRDTPGMSVSKKKAPPKGDRGKGMELLFDAALIEAAQVKEALQKSKKDSHMLHASGSGDGVGSQPKVPDESEDKTTDSGDDESNDDNSDEVTKDDDEDDVESDANEDKEASDSEKTDSDDDENLNVNQNDDKEQEHNEHEEVGKGDAEMTNTTHESAFKENSYEQVIEDAHVTLTSSQKIECSKKSSSVSSNFARKILNLDNIPPVIDEVDSLMNVKTPHEESSTQVSLILSVHVTAIDVLSCRVNYLIIKF